MCAPRKAASTASGASPLAKIKPRYLLPSGRADDLTGQAREQQFKIRERHWLECISDRFGSAVLFVCGAEHTSRFEALLVENGWQPKVLEPNWGREIYAIEDK